MSCPTYRSRLPGNNLYCSMSYMSKLFNWFWCKIILVDFEKILFQCSITEAKLNTPRWGKNIPRWGWNTKRWRKFLITHVEVSDLKEFSRSCQAGSMLFIKLCSSNIENRVSFQTLVCIFKFKWLVPCKLSIVEVNLVETCIKK